MPTSLGAGVLCGKGAAPPIGSVSKGTPALSRLGVSRFQIGDFLSAPFDETKNPPYIIDDVSEGALSDVRRARRIEPWR